MRPRCSLNGNIELEHREMNCEYVNWVKLSSRGVLACEVV